MSSDGCVECALRAQAHARGRGGGGARAREACAGEAVLKEKVAQWRGAVERMTEGEAVSEEDIQVKEAKLVERVVDGIFAFER